MSNIRALPIYRVSDGVGVYEDWTLTFVLTLSDGVTPLDLSGIAFTANIWPPYGSPHTIVGVVSGASNNVLTFTALASAKVNWFAGICPLTILATDGVLTQDLIGFSTLALGSPQLATVTPLTAAQNSLSPVPAWLAGYVLSSLLTASPSSLLPLTQALLASAPNVNTGGVAPATGGAFVNASSYVVIAT
jgi:hypothetical protein